MLSSSKKKKMILRFALFSLAGLFVSFLPMETRAKIIVEKNAGFGVIKGVVRDESGSPISEATVAFFQIGTSKLLKQVRSAADGSFLARILPGTYKVLAVAEGFNPFTLAEVSVNRSAELTYGFKLEKAGSGNTLPEKRADRNNPKWNIRAAASQRSIYQNQEGNAPIDEKNTARATEETIGVTTEETTENSRRGQSVVETFVSSAPGGFYTSFNFATAQPLSDNAEIIVAGQTGRGEFAPQRVQGILKFRPNGKHQLRFTASAARLGELQDSQKQLGQVSFQTTDEWEVKKNVILVLGFDYSRFVGASDDAAIAPRLGLQFDINAKTRFRAAYTTQTEENSWTRAVELEDAQIAFREPVAVEDFVVKNKKPLLNKSRRVEFGVERVLGNNSNIEATAFFDTVSNRGVGLISLPADVLDPENFVPFTAEQQGKSQGVRFVYARRFGKTISASAGYSLGRGQKISSRAISNPAEIFRNGFFQSFAGQINADLKTGTRVKTIFRLSPDATIFAIDPFQGRLAIYDPSLSILVTQSLPNLGLPIRAEAVFDARNVLDCQTGVSGEEGSLKLSSQRRVLRGGISVRF